MDKREVGQSVNWLDLPLHLFDLILMKLVYIKDYISFGAVCHSWHSVYTQNRDTISLNLPSQLPILLVTTEPKHYIRNWRKTRSFYDLSENKVCKFPLPVSHLDYYNNFFSSKGWLIDFDCQRVLLVHPFLSVDNVITLPGLQDEDNDMGDPTWIRKAVLSANPVLNPNYVLLAVCGGICLKAAFYKPGNCQWTSLLDEEDCLIVDVIYYGNKFYAMSLDGSVWACDLSSSLPTVSKVAPCIDNKVQNYGDFFCYYVVESFGELLGVKRNWRSEEPYYTLNFQVFRLDQNMFEWMEIKSLGGRSLFVGNNSSISIMASDFPRCKPNCIYFTHEGRNNEPFDEVSHDMGVYNLEDGSIKPHYPMESIKHNYPAPIWIEPTFIQSSSSSNRSLN